MDLLELREKATRFGIGLSVGDSCTHIEAALVRVRGCGPGVHLKVLHTETFPLRKGLHNRLMAPRKEARELGLLHFELGEVLASVAKQMGGACGEQLEQPDYVSIQGFRAAHTPRRGQDSAAGGFELGAAAVVAEQTGLPVFSDFHSRDMAAGGQGKPLFPYVDWLMLAREDRTYVHLHVGANSSLTVIPPVLEEVMAFEAGPCNLVIDGAIQYITSGNREFDESGTAAAKGVVVDEFLDYLLDHPYFNRVPPKSTMRDEFGRENYLRDALSGRREHSMEDLVATVTTAVAFATIRAYQRFIKPSFRPERLVVSGGGVKNKTLLRQLKKGIEGPAWRATDQYGLSSEALDGVRVALLGNETLCGKPGNAARATGARGPVILGSYTPA